MSEVDRTKVVVTDEQARQLAADVDTLNRVLGDVGATARQTRVSDSGGGGHTADSANQCGEDCGHPESSDEIVNIGHAATAPPRATTQPAAATAEARQERVCRRRRYRPIKVHARTMNVASFEHEPFAFYDEAQRSWRSTKTSLLSAADDASESTRRASRGGSMRAGRCWEQSPLPPLLIEGEQEFWPTPLTHDADQSRSRVWDENRRTHTPGGFTYGMSLATAVGMAARGGSTRETVVTPCGRVFERDRWCDDVSDSDGDGRLGRELAAKHGRQDSRAVARASDPASGSPAGQAAGQVLADTRHGRPQDRSPGRGEKEGRADPPGRRGCLPRADVAQGGSGGLAAVDPCRARPRMGRVAHGVPSMVDRRKHHRNA